MSIRLPSALTPEGTVTDGSGPDGEETKRSAVLEAVDRFGDYWMLGVFVRSITTRSMPMPSPPAGGIP